MKGRTFWEGTPTELLTGTRAYAQTHIANGPGWPRSEKSFCMYLRDQQFDFITNGIVVYDMGKRRYGNGGRKWLRVEMKFVSGL